MSYSPGKVNTTDYRNFYDSEVEILKHLEKFLFITFAKKKEFKRKTYGYVFIKFPPNQEKLLYTNREILLIFIDNQSFNHRTLDFVDRIMSEYHNRLYKPFFILLGNNNQLFSQIQDVRNTYKGSKLAVSSNYQDIFNYKDEKQFWNLIKTVGYDKDFFGEEKPLVSDLFFFGRKEELKHLYNNYKRNSNSGLFGLRKTGKTSVLNAIIRRLRENGELGVLINCESPEISIKRWYQLLEYIVDRLYNKYNDESDIYSIKSNKKNTDLNLSNLSQKYYVKNIM